MIFFIWQFFYQVKDDAGHLEAERDLTGDPVMPQGKIPQNIQMFIKENIKFMTKLFTTNARNK